MKLERQDDDIDFGYEDKLSNKKEDGFATEDCSEENWDDTLPEMDMQTDIPMAKHKDLLKELTDFAPYLKDKFNGWLGIIWDAEKERYVKNPYLKPVMNMQCAFWLIDWLKTYARDNNIITDIDYTDYNFMKKDIIDVLWLNVGTRDEEFGILEEGDILRICVEMEHAAALVLMGAGDGKYTKFLQGANYFNHNLQAGMDRHGRIMPATSNKRGWRQKVHDLLFGKEAS